MKIGADDILAMPEPPQWDEVALVVFSSVGSHALAGFLHPRIKHCFAVVPAFCSPGYSVQVDLNVDGLVTAVAGKPPLMLVDHYERQGYEVVCVPYRPENRHKLPTLTNNCVGLTKALTGIESWALTPYRLWRHLTKGQDYAALSGSQKVYRSSEEQHEPQASAGVHATGRAT